ncbi:hypothetical protein [Hyunsoonleella pacifica]|uniref:Uncharacterized protein n=1 Tax=Hyunsoonleella pacifica TaxID=1080224 RepID=A0A4V2JB46_9FLAO|nr:hypothetical protein [Hyunsoonleella pacifica]TBN16783.1 hypothetical protein EYD46_09145 [Hyunsoonleella pacifica]GGD16421.1 hypothetical protein GCM10011368_18000 [Hyunsoonleella pacifica]
MKKFFVLLYVFGLLFSCSEKDDFIPEMENSLSEKNILTFTSIEDLKNTISEIDILKREQEHRIYDVSYSSIPNSSVTSNIKEIDYSKILPALEGYHKKSLKNVYELREKLGFTSLQSIVEEINSLKLLNPQKADELFNNFSKFLVQSKFEVSSVFGDKLSNILNEEARVMVNDELLDLNSNSTNESQELMQGLIIEGNVQLEDNNGGQTSNKLIQNDSGILFLNDFMAVIWEVGKKRNTSNIFSRYDYFSRISGFIRIPGGGKYVSYPISWELEPGSYCEYNGITNPFRFGFPEKWTNVNSITNRGYKSSRNFYLNKVYITRGIFSIEIDNEKFTILSDPFLRNYDNYDPDNPIYD